MTKKDYEVIARALASAHCSMMNRLIERRNGADPTTADKQALIRTTDIFVAAVSRELAKNNSAFSATTFYGAVIDDIGKDYMP